MADDKTSVVNKATEYLAESLILAGEGIRTDNGVPVNFHIPKDIALLMAAYMKRKDEWRPR